MVSKSCTNSTGQMEPPRVDQPQPPDTVEKLGKIQGDSRKFLDHFKSYFGSQISSQSLNVVHIYRLGQIQGDGRKFLDRLKSYFAGSQTHHNHSMRSISTNYSLNPEQKVIFSYIFVSDCFELASRIATMVNEADAEVLLGKQPHQKQATAIKNHGKCTGKEKKLQSENVES